MGGMERVMSELATYLCKQSNNEVHLVMYGLDPVIFYSLPDNIHIHKPSFTFNNNLRFIYTLKTLLFIRRKINQIRPDSILNFGEYFNSLLLVALLGKKFPVYISDRCQPNKNLGIIHNLLRKSLYPKAMGVIVQTDAAKEIYKRMVPKAKLSVIGNPIRAIAATSQIKKENIVLTVGRLIESKHHDHLIELFVKLDMPDWKLIIVGDDALRQKNREKLEYLILRLKFGDRIILAGAQENVDEYYLKSKVFAFASSSEGFPNVIGEAMSAGLPVVAYNCIAGPSELIQDGMNGFLVPLYESELFRHRLCSLMQDSNLREKLGNEARESVKRFSVNTICEKYNLTLTNNLM